MPDRLMLWLTKDKRIAIIKEDDSGRYFWNHKKRTWGSLDEATSVPRSALQEAYDIKIKIA